MSLRYPKIPARSASLFLTAALLIIAPTVWSGQVEVIDGVTHIQNPSSPTNGSQRLDLEEMWRTGGENDDNFFGQIIRVRGDEEGNVYLMDSQMLQASVFAPDGELIQTLFKEGDGPGEIRWNCDLLLMPGGDIASVRRFPGALVTVDKEGLPTSNNFKPGDIPVHFNSGNSGGGNLVFGCNQTHERDDGTRDITYSLASFNIDGTEQARYLETSWHVDYHNNFTFVEKQALNDFLFSNTVGPNGRVYVLSNRDEYRISVFEPGGTLTKVIERDFTPQKRSDDELARIKAITTRRFRTFPFDISFEFSENESVIPWYFRGLQACDDGSLWIRHSQSARPEDASILVVFDVFDQEGHFDKQVEIAAPGNARRDGVFIIGQDKVVVVHGYIDAMRSLVGGGRGPLDDEDPDADPIGVVCYRIR